jgi:hypothetical protein
MAVVGYQHQQGVGVPGLLFASRRKAPSGVVGIIIELRNRVVSLLTHKVRLRVGISNGSWLLRVKAVTKNGWGLLLQVAQQAVEQHMVVGPPLGVLLGRAEVVALRQLVVAGGAQVAFHVGKG